MNFTLTLEEINTLETYVLEHMILTEKILNNYYTPITLELMKKQKNKEEIMLSYNYLEKSQKEIYTIYSIVSKLQEEGNPVTCFLEYDINNCLMWSNFLLKWCLLYDMVFSMKYRFRGKRKQYMNIKRKIRKQLKHTYKGLLKYVEQCIKTYEKHRKQYKKKSQENRLITHNINNIFSEIIENNFSEYDPEDVVTLEGIATPEEETIVELKEVLRNGSTNKRE